MDIHSKHVITEISLVLLLMWAQGASAQLAHIPSMRQISQSPLAPLRADKIRTLPASQFLTRSKGNLKFRHLRLQLRRSKVKEEAYKTYMEQLHNPKSPFFRKWMTKNEIGEEFGPSTKIVERVKGWMLSRGLVPRSVSATRMFVEYSATIDQLRAAYHIDFKHAKINDRTVEVNTSAPYIPSDLLPYIASVGKLNTLKPQPLSIRFSRLQSVALRTPYPNLTIPPPQEAFFVGPQDFAKIYNLAPVWSSGTRGAGQTIAIVGGSNISPSDWQTFRTAFGLSGYQGQLSILHPNCSDPGITALEMEADIDTEWAGAVAPDASIELASCAGNATESGIDFAMYNLVNDANPPEIISVSFGVCEAISSPSNYNYYDELWRQAAAEGISVFVSSGDAGSALCDQNAFPATHGLSVNLLADSSYVVSVGGTDFSDVLDHTQSQYWDTSSRSGSSNYYESALSYIPEKPWNYSCAAPLVSLSWGEPNTLNFCNNQSGHGPAYYRVVGSGGGESVFGPITPPWQDGTYGAPTDDRRGMPDVSLFSANGSTAQALLLCDSDANQGHPACNYQNDSTTYSQAAGGTSFAAPQFAGIQALINQKLDGRIGNPNYILYKIAKLEFNVSSDQGYGTLATCDSSAGSSASSDCVFYDVTEGSSAQPCQPGSPDCYSRSGDTVGVTSLSTSTFQPAYPAKPGWDSATGLGSVNVNNLIDAVVDVDSSLASGYVATDANGDGNSDIYLRNDTTGELERMYMSGADLIHTVTQNISPSLVIEATGDMSGDGKTDLAFVDQNMHVWVGESNGETNYSLVDLGQAPSGAALVGSADINADGYDDIVIEDEANGQIIVWQMIGTTISNTVTTSVAPGSMVGGMGDFDGNGYMDMVYINSNNMYILESMPNNGFTSTSAIGTVPANSRLVASGDIDGDGNLDLIFFNDVAHEVTIYWMNGVTPSSGTILSIATDQSLRSVGRFLVGRDEMILSDSTRHLYEVEFTTRTSVLEANIGYNPAYGAGWHVVMPSYH